LGSLHSQAKVFGYINHFSSSTLPKSFGNDYRTTFNDPFTDFMGEKSMESGTRVGGESNFSEISGA
jgi:hypothetical protein